MNINISFFPKQIFSICKETIVLLSREQCRKIFLIFTLALCGFTLFSLIRNIIQKSKLLNSKALPPLEKKIVDVANQVIVKAEDKFQKLDEAQPNFFINLNPAEPSPAKPIEQAKPEVEVIQHEPFPFLQLPNEIQFSVYSFLSPIEIAQQKRVKKQINHSLNDVYLKRLDVQFKLLLDLKKIYIEGNQKSIISEQLQSCLDTILNNDQLEKFLLLHSTFREEFFEYLNSDFLTFHQNLQVKWSEKDTKVFELIIKLFFEYANDEQLRIFMSKHVFHTSKYNKYFYKLTSPDITQFFFNGLTEKIEKRLVNLENIEQELVIAMCLNNKIEARLLTLLYEKNPNHLFWIEIRKTMTHHDILFIAKEYIQLLDTMELLEYYSTDDFLPERMRDLFVTIYGGNKIVFADLFITSVKSLTSKQIKALAWGLKESMQDLIFMTTILDRLQELDQLKEKGILIPDQIVVSLLKEIVSLKANSGIVIEFAKWAEMLTTKEQMKAFIEAVKSHQEPARTLTLRLLILHTDNNNAKISAEERSAIFAECELNYQDYEYLDPESFKECEHIQPYLNFLRSGNEGELNQIFDCNIPVHKTSILLRSLTRGIIISKNLPPIRSCLSIELIKQHFEQRDLPYDFYDNPVPIEDFLCTIQEDDD